MVRIRVGGRDPGGQDLGRSRCGICVSIQAPKRQCWCLDPSKQSTLGTQWLHSKPFFLICPSPPLALPRPDMTHHHMLCYATFMTCFDTPPTDCA